MFRKLGVKISRDALDWLSLDGSFITANVSFFFVVNSSQQFFHQFSMQLRCVRLNVWGLGSEMGCFNRRFSRYFQNHWKKEHGPVRKCSICVQARHFEMFFTDLSQRWPLNSLELHLELASVRCGFPMYMLHAQVFANALHLLVVWESFGLLATRSSAVWTRRQKPGEKVWMILVRQTKNGWDRWHRSATPSNCVQSSKEVRIYAFWCQVFFGPP